MSFEEWFKRSVTATIRAMPWIKDDLRDAFRAGQAYEKALAKKRKPKETK
jgi:hypothetical protein